MNSDLTQTDKVISTRNPQDSSAKINGPQASDFQPTATQEVLTQSRSIKVVSSGKPITTQPPVKTAPNSYLLIAALVIVIIGSLLLIAWYKRRQVATKPPEPLPKQPLPARKKKLPRSKRNQTKRR